MAYHDKCGDRKADIFLRIHQIIEPKNTPSELNFWEKRVPAMLNSEDILSWFGATLRKAKHKIPPDEVHRWLCKLDENEWPIHRSWNKEYGGEELVIVLGAAHRVDSRPLIHIPRPNIKGCRRVGAMLRLWATLKHGNDFTVETTIFIFCADEAASERVERVIMYRRDRYLGLGVDIVGIVVRADTFLHSINVADEIVHSVCLKSGEELMLLTPPNRKNKTFSISIGNFTLSNAPERR